MIRQWGVFSLVASAALGGCSGLLGIPEDPYLEEPAPPAPVSAPEPPASDVEDPGAVDSSAPSSDDSDADPSDPDAPDPGGDAADDESQSDVVAESPSEDRPVVTELAGDDEPAAGAPSAAAEDEDEGDVPPVAEAPDDEPIAPAPPACVPERRPVDIVLVADNSVSMAAELDALERSLNGFAAQLDADEVDYRLILLSRHRSELRTASEQASTSLCVTAPLGALTACPALAPAASERFLHYDLAIAESDSFDRILDTFDFPDPHGLAPNGWAERLRPGVSKVVIEFSDGDSARPLQDFLSELSLLAPEHFGADPSAPGFVFHSLVGVRQPAFASAAYAPDEPIEPRTCGVAPNVPDNAGQSYQTLSVLTGGLRFSLCATAALPQVLATLADDVSARSVAPCAAAPTP